MKNEVKFQLDDGHPMMSAQAFAVLGGGKIAYVKPIRSEDVHALYPEAPEMQPGIRLFALHAADGKVSGPGGAAQLLGLKPTTLASRIKALGILPSTGT